MKSLRASRISGTAAAWLRKSPRQYLPNRSQRIAQEFRKAEERDARVAGRRAKADDDLQRIADRTELREKIVDNRLENRRADACDRLGRGEIERGVPVARHDDAVGGQQKRGPAGLVECHADSDGIDLWVTAQQARPAVRAQAGVYENGEPGQRVCGARGQVEAEQIGRDARQRGVARNDADIEMRRHDRASGVAAANRDPDRQLCDTESERDLVARDTSGEQRGEVRRPCGACRRRRDDSREPVAERADALRRQLPDRQRRNVAAWNEAEESCDRRKRRAGSKRVGLCPHDAEDELERRVVELVQLVERHFEIARRAGAW